MSKIKLEVGKTYRNRMGEEVRIVKKDDGKGKYPYIGDDNEWYAENGRYFYYLELKNNPYDLIGEVEKEKK